MIKGRSFDPEQRQAINQRLKQLRLLAGLSTQEMSSALGVDKGRWSNYETGQRLPDALFMVRLAEILGLSLDWLWLGRGNPVVGDQPTYSNPLIVARTKIRTALVEQTQHISERKRGTPT